MPSAFSRDIPGIKQFFELIINKTIDRVAGFKFQMAHFLAMGSDGVALLKSLVDLALPDAYVILDAKFGDIPSTMNFYKKFTFEYLNVDAVTINPFLGFDSIRTFSDNMDRMVFVLCHTSNSGAKDLQELQCGESAMYMVIARKLVEMNMHGNIGVVLGATYPSELKEVRITMGNKAIFLIPGIGIQGGDIEIALNSSILNKNDISLIAMSRSLIYRTEQNYMNAITAHIDKINSDTSKFIKR